jgi:hypothetical protein
MKGRHNNGNCENSKIIRSYYKNLYSTKLGNPDELDDFIDRYQVPKLVQNR